MQENLDDITKQEYVPDNITKLSNYSFKTLQIRRTNKCSTNEIIIIIIIISCNWESIHDKTNTKRNFETTRYLPNTYEHSTPKNLVHHRTYLLWTYSKAEVNTTRFHKFIANQPTSIITLLYNINKLDNYQINRRIIFHN